jgi:hypothetical protein
MSLPASTDLSWQIIQYYSVLIGQQLNKKKKLTLLYDTSLYMSMSWNGAIDACSVSKDSSTGLSPAHKVSCLSHIALIVFFPGQLPHLIVRYIWLILSHTFLPPPLSLSPTVHVMSVDCCCFSWLYMSSPMDYHLFWRVRGFSLVVHDPVGTVTSLVGLGFFFSLNHSLCLFFWRGASGLCWSYGWWGSGPFVLYWVKYWALQNSLLYDSS